jgi:hypothetical protein
MWIAASAFLSSGREILSQEEKSISKQHINLTLDENVKTYESTSPWIYSCFSTVVSSGRSRETVSDTSFRWNLAPESVENSLSGSFGNPAVARFRSVILMNWR